MTTTMTDAILMLIVLAVLAHWHGPYDADALVGVALVLFVIKTVGVIARLIGQLIMLLIMPSCRVLGQMMRDEVHYRRRLRALRRS